METKFQTSFIPKKPLVSGGGSSALAPRRQKTGSGVFMTIATLIFIVSLGAAGGAYAWKSVLISSQDGYKQQLATREKQFNLDLIEQLKQINVKIDIAAGLLANHISVSQIFPIISRLTTESVRFLSLDVIAPSAQSADAKIDLHGYAASFSSVAFQSDVLGTLEQYGLRKIVKNPILSDPALDANGTVAFGFSASVDPGSLSYARSLTSSAATSSPAGSTP